MVILASQRRNDPLSPVSNHWRLRTHCDKSGKPAAAAMRSRVLERKVRHSGDRFARLNKRPSQVSPQPPRRIKEGGTGFQPVHDIPVTHRRRSVLSCVAQALSACFTMLSVYLERVSPSNQVTCVIHLVIARPFAVHTAALCTM